MARKRITRRDPEEELSKFLRHEPGQGQETRKLSSQLTSLKKERRRGLLTRLGSIMAVCLLAIAFFNLLRLAFSRRINGQGARS